MEWNEKPQDELARNFILPAVGTQVDKEECFRLAYQAALQGAGSVAANPLVGAVLVDDQHRFVAAGWHEFFGGPHAEVNLIARIKEQDLEATLKGATLYCTLEPCSIVGKTPACTSLLESLPLARIVIAEQDPNPRVNGQGVALLRKAGKEVLLDEGFTRVVRGLLAPFRSMQTLGRPFIAAKVACSLDGMIGYSGAKRQWLTNERARSYTHWLRQLYDGIVVGADTVIADNPSLDARLYPKQGHKKPWKIVLDPRGRALCNAPLDASNLIKNQRANVLWCLSSATLQQLSPSKIQEAQNLNIELLALPYHQDYGLGLPALISELVQRGVSSLLLEGGRQVWASFAKAGLLDRLHLVQAPSILGLPRSMHWTQALNIAAPLRLAEARVTLLDDNCLLTAEVQNEGKIGE